ncbi:cache domain-containing protein [Roseibium aggregatum]|uniref:Cache domain-containing protein n=1 Tax=Roseibium aggregatum TaxID=187304 RepID=A0A939EG99_9HYPH|nr:cache domain-containing protein [Roseibium aggregatum]MBN9671633.1 cache domain-containing protein [Roseibium aggregatum]
MKTLKCVAISAAALTMVGSLAVAGDNGTAEEASAMLDKAVAHYQSVGADKAFKDFTAQGEGWQDRDLYLFCFDAAGNTVAHGANAKMIGRDLSGLKDADGKAFIAELIATGKAGGGWVDYRWPNPVSKKVEQKSSVVKAADDYVCGVGIYK